MKKETKLLSIVFSFRNEEENLKELIQRVNKIKREIPNWNIEMIFVNDYSNDNSLNILKEEKKVNNIKILNMSRRFGQSACVFAGFENSSGDAVIYMDSDLQDPPELIPNLIKKYEEGYDVVHTKRTKRLGENFIKMKITNIAYKIINLFSNISLPEQVGDFKLLSRKAVNNFCKINEIDPYFRGLSVWIGFRQTYIEYVRESRHKGNTHFPLFGNLNPSAEFLRGVTSFSSAPLYFSLFLGVLTLIVSIFLIFYGLYLKITGNAVPGTSGILVAIAFFSGVMLFTLGVIGIYLSRIYNQIKGRPRYILDEID